MLRRAEEGGEIVASLAFLTVQQNEAGETEILARATRSGQGRALAPYTGEEEIGTNAEYLLSVDTASSGGVLAQSNAFREYLGQVRDLKVLVDQTVEIQGRLITAIRQAISEAGATPGVIEE